MRLGLFALCLATFGVAADKVDVTGKWQLSVELSAGSGIPRPSLSRMVKRLPAPTEAASASRN